MDRMFVCVFMKECEGVACVLLVSRVSTRVRVCVGVWVCVCVKASVRGGRGVRVRPGVWECGFGAARVEVKVW